MREPEPQRPEQAGESSPGLAEDQPGPERAPIEPEEAIIPNRSKQLPGRDGPSPPLPERRPRSWWLTPSKNAPVRLSPLQVLALLLALLGLLLWIVVLAGEGDKQESPAPQQRTEKRPSSRPATPEELNLLTAFASPGLKSLGDCAQASGSALSQRLSSVCRQSFTLGVRFEASVRSLAACKPGAGQNSCLGAASSEMGVSLEQLRRVMVQLREELRAGGLSEQCVRVVTLTPGQEQTLQAAARAARAAARAGRENNRAGLQRAGEQLQREVQKIASFQRESAREIRQLCA